MSRLIAFILLFAGATQAAELVNLIYPGRQIATGTSLTTEAQSGLELEAEVQAFTNNIALASGTIDSADVVAINDFVIAAKSAGYWTNILDASPFAGNNTNAAIVKLVYQTGIASNVSLVGGAAAWDADRGIIGTGSSYVDTRFYVSNFTAPSSHGLTVFKTTTTNTQPNTWNLLGGVQTDKYHVIQETSTASGGAGGVTFFDDAGAPNTTQWRITSFGYGPISLVRTSTAFAAMYLNGVELSRATGATTPPSQTNRSYYILAGNNVSTSNSRASAGWYSLDNGMPTNQIPHFHTNLSRLMDRLGRGQEFKRTIPIYLVVGQSLATGGGGTAGGGIIGNITTNFNVSRGALMGWSIPGLSGGPMNPWALVGSREASDGLDLVNSGWQAFQDQISVMTRTNSGGFTNDSLLIPWAEGGRPYSYLQKGSSDMETWKGITTNRYQLSINDFYYYRTNFNTWFNTNGRLTAIISVFGEANAATVAYGTNMIEWRSNYVADATTALGVSNHVVMYHTQQSSQTNQISNTNLVWLHQNYYDDHCLVGPKYFLRYSDGTHLTNISYDVQGEYYAKAEFKRRVLGARFDPVYITNVSRTDDVITLDYAGVVGNLVIDDTNVSDPGNYGFQYTDDSSPPAISSVATSAVNQVTITLASIPTGGNKILTYAFPFTGMANSQAPTNSPRGNLRDTDPAIGFTSNSNLWNWAVHQRVTVP